MITLVVFTTGLPATVHIPAVKNTGVSFVKCICLSVNCKKSKYYH